MSMNGHAKRTIQTLEALDFRLDEESSSRGVRVYFHPIDPERRIKVFAGLSEIAAKKARNLASEIIGMASAGERVPSSLGELARIKRQDEKAKARAVAEREARRREPFQRRADHEAARRADAVREAERIRHEREIRDLMKPGRP